MTEYFKQEQIGDTLVLRLQGRMDAQAVSEMKEEFKNISGKYVLANLADVSFLDSSALGLIVSTLRRIRENDGELALCCLTPRVRTIFELTRLHKVFHIYATEALALAAH